MQNDIFGETFFFFSRDTQTNKQDGLGPHLFCNLHHCRLGGRRMGSAYTGANQITASAWQYLGCVFSSYSNHVCPGNGGNTGTPVVVRGLLDLFKVGDFDDPGRILLV